MSRENCANMPRIVVELREERQTVRVGLYATEREARRAAAGALGRPNLRGLATWPTDDGCAWQTHDDDEAPVAYVRWV